MKQRLLFYLTGLLLVLCNTTAWGEQSPVQTLNKEPECSFISQEQANQQAVCNLFFIYSHTPKEVTVKPHHSVPSLKNHIRLLLRTNDFRSLFQTSFHAGDQSYAHFHPDRVDYYIYTLKKIVI